MALTAEQTRVLKIALADEEIGAAIAAAIDASGSGPAANVPALGATTDIAASAATYAIPAEPTGAEVDTAIDDTIVFVEARLDAIEAKVDAVIASLIAANLMSA